jgi:DNA-directed RNA polymerase beta' subunit
MAKFSSVKDFSTTKPLIAPIDLNEVQLKSYRWFLEKGLKEIFDEISPIVDHTGKEFKLSFTGYRFDEPKYDEPTARYKEATYEASLRVTVKLENQRTGAAQSQEIYFGDFPIMTSRGTFIVNGVERVVVSQLVRSSGVAFSSVPWHGKQLFGAKIIPTRGAWLEFETAADGEIAVKIDRRRKIPVTDILRIFGMTTEDIRKAFTDEHGPSSYIEATLRKDAAEDAAMSYVEIYRRLRPGDPANADTAKNLVSAMFERADRYDLSEVGRYKMNQRLSLDKKKESRLLDTEDLVAIVREIIRLNGDPNAEADDIDHLGNRRLKTVGELLQGRMRIGLARLRRIVQDRMSTEDRDTIQASQLVNFRPITAVVKEFFASSQLSQFMDQVNPLAELEHKRRISALGPGGLTRERASFEVRDVHRSHYGRICPIQSPEGANVGLINYLASFTKVNDFGFLEAPYAKVVDGKVTKEIVWFDAFEEEKYNITHAGTPRDAEGRLQGELVEARIKGEAGTCAPSEVDYIDVAPHEFVSVATSLIPFLQNDDASRALMGSNMQRQAVVSVHPDAPYVSTGQEDSVALHSGYVIMAEDDGVVASSDGAHITVKYAKLGTKHYTLEKFKRSNQFTCISQKPLVTTGDAVKKGQIMTDGPSIENGVLALGQNLLVAFVSWEGANFEDAIILSERVVREDRFTSIHIDEYSCDVRDTKLGPEITTYDIPNISEDKLKNLDEEGIIRIGAEVKPGDILVGKISPKGESELTSEERLLRAIFGEKARDVKDTSLTLPHGKIGRVVNVKIFDRERGDKLEPGVIRRIQIEIAELRKVQAGDKLAGRHGNKGVISQVRAVEDMPYLADGTPVDIILNPLGVISRMNLGQILETHLGWAASRLGYRAITPGLDSATEEAIRAELKKAGLPEDGKTDLYDGRTGELFKNRVMVGQIYMLKLNHLVEDKAHVRSIGPYSLITQQPLGGKAQFGGQRFGEMEVWALEGYGARHTLQEMLTIKSDDILGRAAAYESIIRGETIKEPNVPASFNVLVSELKSLGFNIQPIYFSESDHRDAFSALKIAIASPEDILRWSHGEVIKPETINYRTQRPEKDGLFSERIFGPTKDYECYCGKYRRIRYKGVVCDKCGVEVTKASVRRERMGHITLAAPATHIWFLKSIPSRLSLMLDVSTQKLERVIYYSAYIITEVEEENRKVALEELERELKGKLKTVGTKDKDVKGEIVDAAETTRDYLKNLRVGQILSETEYFNLSRKFGSIFKASSGAEAVREILEKMDLRKEVRTVEAQIEKIKDPLAEGKLLRRLKMLKAMVKNGTRPEWMVLTVLPVLPPDLRPMVALEGGRYATSDLNDLYRRVINRNNRLKKLLEIKAPDVIIRNEKRMLQEAVDALIDNSARFGTQEMSAQRRPLRSLADMLKGKQGRFRQNLLGKRVDYSGRSVIVVGPKLKFDECGVPKQMALELFRPFVISEILKRGLSHNIRSAGRFMEEHLPEALAILEEVIKGKRVLLNRAPTLHRLSVQAFKPMLVEGLALKIPPLVCPAFNADFDGDQMAIHLPLGAAAQEEAENIMASGKNLLKPANGDLVAAPMNDIVLGIYFITRKDEEAPKVMHRFSSFDEAILAYHFGVVKLQTPIIWNGIETTVGRMIFNRELGGYVPYVNETMTKKKLNKMLNGIFESHDVNAARETIDRVKLLGFEMASISGITWAISELMVPPEKKALLADAEKAVAKVTEQFEEGLLTDSERKARVITIWRETQAKIAAHVSTILPHYNSVYQIVESGSRGSWSQPMMMMGMKGLVSNPKGETIELPVKSSLKEGLSVLEYFIATHGARKGTTDTALKTAQAGYLTRRLVDVSQELTVREEDCRAKEGIELRREDGKEFNQSFASKLFSRTALGDVKIGNKIVVRANEVITKAAAEEIERSKIESVVVRSPITCRTLYGVCAKCYGYDLGVNEPVRIGTAVGVIAAQSIGEPGTQLTMRTFHAGGAAQADITHGLPRVEEIFEARTPKGRAAMAPFDGTVQAIEERGSQKIIRVVSEAKKAKAQEITLSRGAVIFVKAGDIVKKGDQLSEGTLDIHELYEQKGAMDVVRYITNEVQRIYLSEGAAINNKHIEMIVRQMVSRVQVTDAGDIPDFVAGDIVEKSKFLEVNREAKRDDRRPAKGNEILLGITRVALSAESFLSAASFQDTSRVLVKAAIESKIDPLRGLKENVIIGRLIPAGTGRTIPVIDDEDVLHEEETVGPLETA